MLDTDNINLIPRLKEMVLKTVIPGMVNHVRKTSTTGAGKQKIQADDQALYLQDCFLVSNGSSLLAETQSSLSTWLLKNAWKMPNCILTNLPL